MRRTVYYREGYKIVIMDNFYEVSDGKTALYYEECVKQPTIEYIWNKTLKYRQTKPYKYAHIKK